MSHHPIQSPSVQRLVSVNRDVHAEGLAQADDRRPADGEAGGQDRNAGRPDPMGASEDCVRMCLAVPRPRPDRAGDNNPENEDRPAITHGATASSCPCQHDDPQLRDNPRPKQNLPESERQRSSQSSIQRTVPVNRTLTLLASGMTRKWDCAPAPGGCTMINTEPEMPSGLSDCSRLDPLDRPSVQFSWQVVFRIAREMKTVVAWYYETERCHVGDF